MMEVKATNKQKNIESIYKYKIPDEDDKIKHASSKFRQSISYWTVAYSQSVREP